MSAPVQPGDVLAKKYRVDRVLGKGGMGVVVSATHLQLGQKVALKFMLPAATEVEGAAERFLREARAAVRLRSEYVAKVSDVGTLDDGAPYMVMEYLDGSDLGEVLEKRGRLDISEAVNYIIQACTAMAEAHGAHIVHRDLKPANLFLTKRPDGRPLVKVLDFGVSKLLDNPGTGVSATQTGIAMGSPAYMAPEQMKSAKQAGPRADVWSLGAVLFHLLSGRLPFIAETFTEMFAVVLTERPRALMEIVPNVPPALANVIYGCLEKDPDRRMPSVVALATHLAPFASPHGQMLAGSLTGRAVTPFPPPSVMPNATPPPFARPPLSTSRYSAGEVAQAQPQTKSKAPLVLVTLLALGLGVGLAVSLGGGSDDETSSAAGQPAGADAAVVAIPDAAAPVKAAVVEAGLPDAGLPDAGLPDASVPDAAPKKKKRKKKKRRPGRDRDPFGNMR